VEDIQTITNMYFSKLNHDLVIAVKLLGN